MSLLIDEAEALTPVVPRRYTRFVGDQPEAVEAGVIGEIRFTIFVEDRELVTLMCSAWQLRPLVVGFLYLEGLIEGIDDLEMLRVCLEDRLADVRLAHGFPDVPPRKILTSGCTGGVSFGKYLDQIEQFRITDDNVCVAPGQMYGLLRELYDSSHLYRASGGVHTSVLALEGESAPRYVAEDIGRHNTIDKLQGMALLDEVPTRGGVILASGRISSEMLFKAAIMGVPVVGSRTSPTNLALTVADRLNITVCGYLRQGSMNVYTHPERIRP
ncbi:MAG: formate dehydrogenase accessory sulfurtransferase FdhD [Chloroflexi bacterium]|nr:formate dehydrogenase accessory sulfurtransferase FdhD [Chloroflexota bacterium]MBV9132794.1 formate dehydrogenase accessory sulfurtransferase FdhD [Chloroflexota bacterium]MBV9897811.1 formate dehydrogenase accessory sulfurtransferase FdhD [Chloroflexota bacterium]